MLVVVLIPALEKSLAERTDIMAEYVPSLTSAIVSTFFMPLNRLGTGRTCRPLAPIVRCGTGTTSASGRTLVAVEINGTASPFSLTSSLPVFSRSSVLTTRLAALLNLRAVLESPDERGKYVEVVVGVAIGIAGPDATRVNCREVVVDAGS